MKESSINGHRSVVFIVISVLQISRSAGLVGRVNFDCPDGFYVSEFSSSFGKGQRHYDFGCSSLSTSSLIREKCERSEAGNSGDGDIFLTCRDDQYTAGVSIIKDNLRNSWSLLCCSSEDVQVVQHQCRTTNFIHQFSEPFSIRTEQTLIRKWQALHNTTLNDHRWWLQICPFRVAAGSAPKLRKSSGGTEERRNRYSRSITDRLGPSRFALLSQTDPQNLPNSPHSVYPSVFKKAYSIDEDTNNEQNKLENGKIDSPSPPSQSLLALSIPMQALSSSSANQRRKPLPPPPTRLPPLPPPPTPRRALPTPSSTSGRFDRQHRGLAAGVEFGGRVTASWSVGPQVLPRQRKFIFLNPKQRTTPLPATKQDDIHSIPSSMYIKNSKSTTIPLPSPLKSTISSTISSKSIISSGTSTISSTSRSPIDVPTTFSESWIKIEEPDQIFYPDHDHKQDEMSANEYYDYDGDGQSNLPPSPSPPTNNSVINGFLNGFKQVFENLQDSLALANLVMPGGENDDQQLKDQEKDNSAATVTVTESMGNNGISNNNRKDNRVIQRIIHRSKDYSPSASNSNEPPMIKASKPSRTVADHHSTVFDSPQQRSKNSFEQANFADYNDDEKGTVQGVLEYLGLCKGHHYPQRQPPST